MGHDKVEETIPLRKIFEAVLHRVAVSGIPSGFAMEIWSCLSQMRQQVSVTSGTVLYKAHMSLRQRKVFVVLSLDE